MGIVSIPKKFKNKQIFIDWVRNDQVRYDRVRNDRVRNDLVRSDRVRNDRVRCDRVRNDRELEMIGSRNILLWMIDLLFTFPDNLK